MIKLNLGCGQKYLKGYINTDISRNVKAEKYFDLNKFPYPFRNNYADIIFMDNVLEHLHDIPAVMNELHRIAKSKAIIEIIVPYGKSDGAIQDPTHTHFFTERSMDYFAANNSEAFYSRAKFIILENSLRNANKTGLSKLRHIIPFKYQLRYLLWNMFDHIYFKLQVVK